MTRYEGQAILTYTGTHGELAGTFQRRTRILLKRTAPGVYDITCSADLRQAGEVTVTLPNGQVYRGKVLCQTGQTATLVTSSDEPAYRGLSGLLG